MSVHGVGARQATVVDFDMANECDEILSSFGRQLGLRIIEEHLNRVGDFVSVRFIQTWQWWQRRDVRRRQGRISLKHRFYIGRVKFSNEGVRGLTAAKRNAVYPGVCCDQAEGAGFEYPD